MSWWWLLPTSFVSFWWGAWLHSLGEERVRRIERDRDRERWLRELQQPSQRQGTPTEGSNG